MGCALGRRLRELGWEIRVVAAASEASARKAVRFIGAGRACAGISRHLANATTILLTVPDDEIFPAATELAGEAGKELRGKIVLHTSGALDTTMLEPLRECGAAVASMHPLQTFTSVSVPPLEGKIFAIEGAELAVRMARRIARSLGGIPVSIPASKKPLYHAAGAYAAGLVLAMEEAGVQAMMVAGMQRREAVSALLSLTRQVLDHYEKLGPQKAWTGPLARGDYKVVASHEMALREFSPEFLEAYQAVSRLAARVLSRDSARILEELDSLSDDLELAGKPKGGNA